MSEIVESQSSSIGNLRLDRSRLELPVGSIGLVGQASVIEKETSVDAERPLVSAVFTNRLRKNMRLQSDPTVIYSLPHFDGNIRRRDLSYDSPYNTYRYKGLPPGPIASPGLASIRAALHPAESDFLYFVATRKGAHKFSRTYKEHRQAVIRYQIRKGKVDR